MPSHISGVRKVKKKVSEFEFTVCLTFYFLYFSVKNENLRYKYYLHFTAVKNSFHILK